MHQSWAVGCPAVDGEEAPSSQAGPTEGTGWGWQHPSAGEPVPGLKENQGVSPEATASPMARGGVIADLAPPQCGDFMGLNSKQK